MQSVMHVVDLWLLPLSLWLVMFAMGLALVPADFGQIAANSRAYFLGLLSMLVCVPAAGVTIAVLAAPTPALQVGFILLATCPGGLLSNLLTRLSRGDLALSVSLSLSTSLIYIVTLPFIARAAFEFVFGEAHAIELPFAASVWEILRVTVFPIACGMLVRRWRERAALRWLPHIQRLATVSLCIIFGLIVIENLPTLRRSWGVVLAMVAAMNVVNLLIALVISRLGALRREERIAVTIEHLIRQEATAIFVAVTILGRTDMSLPMIINTFVGMAVCAVFITVLKSSLRSRGLTVPDIA